LDIRAFVSSKEYVDLLILALTHPENTTPIRAAWILGKLGEPRAVPPLIALLTKAKDIYASVAAVRALGQICTAEAIAFLESLSDHPAKILRDEVRKILQSQATPSAQNSGEKDCDRLP
jgi:HEAT repeat protein